MVRGALLDMSQYPKLFGTARIPMTTGCQMRTTSDSRHLVIMRRGQFYWFEVSFFSLLITPSTRCFSSDLKHRQLTGDVRS